jgi:arginyl-tRNA synthetase
MRDAEPARQAPTAAAIFHRTRPCANLASSRTIRLAGIRAMPPASIQERNAVTDIYARMRETVLTALRGIVSDLPDEVAARVEVTPTRDPTHGDMATNAALVSAKAARQAPAKIAAALVSALGTVPDIRQAASAGPGFVNLSLQPEAFRSLLPIVLRSGISYGDSAIGKDTKVNVEYVSANPTGPMHIGHCRGAVVGDALANLLGKAGYDVTKEYYINDAGAQVTALAWAAYWRYLQAIGTPLSEEEFSNEVPSGLQYRGDYLIPVGQQLAERYGVSLAQPDKGIAAPETWIDVVRDYTIQTMMTEVRTDLGRLGVQQDVFTSERSLAQSGAVDTAIDWLDQRGLIYEGVLEPPKGKTPDDWEPRPQTLFRSTQYGDDVDRPLRKSDGSNTYFANDIAYHAEKVSRGYDVIIDVLGADHGGYVKRMQAAVQAISEGRTQFEAVLCQIVHIVRGGQPVRMSKRAGTYVTLSDLLDEVGRDAVRFTMLTRKADAQMEFDLDQAVAQTRDNPVFYVQYAHARCRSVLRAAAEMFSAETTTDQALSESPLESLEAESELALIRRLASWPRLVEGAAIAREPHRVAFFLNDLASDFHLLWNRGKDDATLRFLQPDRPTETLARLALVAATAVVIRSGLAVLGVDPVEEMR